MRRLVGPRRRSQDRRPLGRRDPPRKKGQSRKSRPKLPRRNHGRPEVRSEVKSKDKRQLGAKIKAAKRRKNTAHGASRGWIVKIGAAPEGRKRISVSTPRAVLSVYSAPSASSAIKAFAIPKRNPTPDCTTALQPY